MNLRVSLGLSALAVVVACGSSKSSLSASASASDGASSAGRDGSHGGSGSGSGSGSKRDGGSSGSSASTGAGSDAGSGSGSGIDAGASVVMMHHHVNRDGFFTDSLISAATAPSFAIDSSFNGVLSTNTATSAKNNVYATPLYVENGVMGKGTFYVATEAGTLYALDEATGGVTWHTNVAPSPAESGVCAGNISPIGITGTPAIDLATRLIVFDSPTADGSQNIATHVIYGLSIDTGNIVWQVDVSTVTDGHGTAFTPATQNQRSAVLILSGVAYVAYGGHYGDCGTYRGWLVGVPLDGQGVKAWATSTDKAGMWGPGGPSSDGQSIFVSTGNAPAVDAGVGWSESEGMFRLDQGPSFAGGSGDSFAVYNWDFLDLHDKDLGGSMPLVIDAPAISPTTLLLGQGKDGNLYLVDRTNLGGVATMTEPANVGELNVSNGEITNVGAWTTWNGTTYVVVRPNGNQGGVGCPGGTSGALVGVKLDPTAASKMSVVWCADPQGNGSPTITWSGQASDDPLVWVLGAGSSGSGKLLAFDLVTGAAVAKGGSTTASNVRSFTTPVPVHGRIFVAGDNQLFAFKSH